MDDDDDDICYDDDGNMDGMSDGGDMGSDEEEEETPENVYYNAKTLAEDSIPEALKKLKRVVELEKPKGEFGFKALKKTIKLELQLRKYSDVLVHFNELLTYIKNAVSNNVSEKGINTILDIVSNAGNVQLTQQMYDAASKALLETKNNRVWFRVNSKLAQVLLDAREYSKLEQVAEGLHKCCTLENGQDDPKKASQLVEIYALEIQLHTALNNTDKLKALSKKALQWTSAIPHPRVLGVIRECSGMVHMDDHDWTSANQDFFDAFKNFDEAGSPRRIQCLKYLVFARIIELSDINPFSSPEILPYQKDPQIALMRELYEAYEKLDTKRFEALLNDSGSQVKNEAFMSRYIPELLSNVRSKAMLRILKPYRRATIPFVSNELGVTPDECERLLVSLILDNKVRGKIDQMSKLILVDTQQNSSSSKYTALTKWSRQLQAVNTTLSNKMA